MSMVSSITISTRQTTSISVSPPASPPYDSNQAEGSLSSDSDDSGKARGRKAARASSPKKDYDEERGLYRVGRSGRKSSREKLLEQELNTADPELSRPVVKVEDDDYGDKFIIRRFVKEGEEIEDDTQSNSSEDSQGKSVYEKKNVPPPRKISQPGNRIQSRQGKLFDQYEKDLTFESEEAAKQREVVRSSQPISHLKSTYNQTEDRKSKHREEAENELEEIRKSMQRRTTAQDEDSDDDRREPNEAVPDVKSRKSLSSIKDKFLAAAQGKRVATSSDSEDEEPTKPGQIDIVASPTGVGNAKDFFQRGNEWRPGTKEDARAEINSSSVSEAMNWCKKMESKRDDNYNYKPSVNKPKSSKVQDPQTLMAARRQKTYGDDDEVEAHISAKTDKSDIHSIDLAQIRSAKQGYEDLEARKAVQPSLVNRPSAKIIREDRVMETMEQHKRRTSEGDEQDEGHPNEDESHVDHNGVSNGYYESEISVGHSSIKITTH